MAKTISAEEAKRRLRATQRLEDVVVEGSLKLYGEKSAEWSWFLESVTIRGHLSLARVDLKSLHLRNVHIERELDLSDAKLEGGLALLDTSVGELLFLYKTKIGRQLLLSGLKVRGRGIVVDSVLAEVVHWAAPNIPLIVRFPDYS